MDFSKFSFVRLESDHVFKPFDCGDCDLNDFFTNDSKDFYNHLLAVTYIIESEDETVGFFSLLNDKISVTDLNSNRKWKRLFRDRFPNNKRFKSYPAVKIGRFAVSNNYQNQGIGKNILDFLKHLFISNNRTGCRYITVDAYDKSLPFYKKNYFNFLTESDIGQDTRLMYYDLKQLTNQ